MIPKIELPLGFRAAGINSGVRRYRPDLGAILSECDCVAAGVFTRNSLKAAPVQYCQKILPAKNIRAIVVNSGQANAATGAARSSFAQMRLRFARNFGSRRPPDKLRYANISRIATKSSASSFVRGGVFFRGAMKEGLSRAADAV